MPTEPAGISLRGVSRRGVANCFGNPARNGKPGTNPMQATRYSLPLWRSTTSLAEICACSATRSMSSANSGIVANWNFDWRAHGFRPSHAPTAKSARGCNFANSFCQPIEQLAGFSAHFRDDDRIKENCDAGISRREVNNAGNSGIAKQVKCTEDLVQRFLRRILKLVADTHNESGISKSVTISISSAKHLRRQFSRNGISCLCSTRTSLIKSCSD